MAKNILHITNGNALTDYLRDLDFKDDILTWQEMLCEGPTIPAINSRAFLKLRTDFLKKFYDIEVNTREILAELSKLDDTDKYSEINLWFEYDLFCHINLIGVINLLHQKEIKKPLYLICSGRVEGEKRLKGLGELNPKQLKLHYKEKIRLTQEDIDLTIALWRTYCGKDHNILKPYIVTNSSFKYMSNCLKAHLKRFPHQKSGLNVLEDNILRIVRDNFIKSKGHLLGYSINYQGFYGFGDIQLERIINKLDIFFDEDKTGLTLNRKGHEALLRQHNFASEINNDMVFGGVQRLEYQFNIKQNKLIKTIMNAN
ncbi:DUF1835 domain-containing protein [Winogradskyella echinorum]|uniref:DUF1835 domain-containing protein n=1 Tax=Winogradskyella echinorum TaxID=538189 RepID=A0ABR6Y0W7_9FLAO|nr:DUF1835 domain-containing protein [Winogradskyella echinorum]MBC3846391.1 DUF1835 domain-containing protein [Winogradskyella echinorum]MBC5750739.1 DUF1835 domain-containing protein [Winogradskyella echinorum]